MLALLGFLFMTISGSTILSDTGCSCATVKNSVTTPNATGSIGCLGKMCLTDQTNGICGSLQSFGYEDSCSNAGFTVSVSSSLLYTGQNLTVSWKAQNILPDEWIRISYAGSTLTKGQGTNVTFGNYTTTMSVAVTAGGPVTISTVSSPQVAANTTQLVVLASGLSGPLVLNNGSVPSGSIPCDDRNITISWFATGQAGAGVTTVTVGSTGGGGPTTVGTPVVQTSVPGNNTVYYKLPRSFTPSSFRTYVPSISATNPNGGTPWVLTAAGFGLSAAPSTTPSSSSTPTPSITPTASISFGSTASSSITLTPTSTPTRTPSLSVGASSSVTPTQTPTPSQTGSVTPTPSQTGSVTPTQSQTASISQSATYTSSSTPAPTPSLNLAALNEAAAEAASSKTATLIGATIGGVVFLVISAYIVHRVLERRRMRDQRLRRMKTFIRTTENAHTVYGIHHPVVIQPVGRPTQRLREFKGKN